MRKRKIGLFVSLVIFGLSLYLLVTGSSVLMLSLSGSKNIPLGTFTTWLGMIALPLIFYFSSKGFREPQSKTARVFALLLKILIVLAILWVPISYLLAGNISNTFTEKAGFQGGQLAMEIFWINSYLTAAAPIVLAIAFGFYALFRKKSE
jgi:hypothetical protein